MGAIDDKIEQCEEDESNADGDQPRTVDADFTRRQRPVLARHGDRPRLEVAPDTQRRGAEHHVDAERRQQLVGERAPLEEAEDRILQHDAEQPHDHHGGEEADEEVRAELRRDHVGHEAAEHDELPVGEVDDPVDAEDEGQPRRRHGKVHAVGGAVDQLLGERGHGIAALPAGDKVWTSEKPDREAT